MGTLIAIEADLWPSASSNVGSLSMPSYAGVCVYVSISPKEIAYSKATAPSVSRFLKYLVVFNILWTC